jgi:phage-related protein
MRIHFFDENVETFLHSLQRNTQAKALRTLDLLETFGFELGMPHVKNVSPKLFELRIRGTQEVRFLFTFHRLGAIILHGFVKKTEKLPLKELRKAQKKKDLLGKA